jgi:uncharacterized protein YprB with RNaseH-like and TPR domain
MASNSLPKKGSALLFMDIETLPADSEDTLWKKRIEAVEQNKGESDEEFAERLEKIHYSSAMLAAFGRVWMIGYSLGSGETVVLSGDGSLKDEKRILQEFWDFLDPVPTPWYIGYNVQGFDLPFLQVRALHHGLTHLARKLGRWSVKPWDRRVIDLMHVWPRTGADKNAWQQGLKGVGKLETVCHVLGVELQTGVMGPDVYNAYKNRDTAGVESHLHHDIRQVRDVFKILWHIM